MTEKYGRTKDFAGNYYKKQHRERDGTRCCEEEEVTAEGWGRS